MPRKFSKGAIDRAGNFFRADDSQIDARDWFEMFDPAYEALSHWRTLHAHPLRVVTNTLKSRATSIASSAIVAQRLKRFASVSSKLLKRPEMALTRMQDIAGCRAVLPSVDDVYRLKRTYDLYAARSRPTSPDLVGLRDYIMQPKPDGYRSLHLVMKYRTSNDRFSDCAGLRVEIQIRSKLQHVWAMAVETASSLTGQALKAGEGREPWKEFFRLMSTAIAIKENLPIVAGTDEGSVYRKIRRLARQLKVILVFDGMGGTVDLFSTEDARPAHRQDLYLLTFDAREQKTYYHMFRSDRFDDAVAAYGTAERSHVNDPDVHVVLVEVGSLRDLRAAYPSYFSDASQFTDLVREFCNLGSSSRPFRSDDRAVFPVEYGYDPGETWNVDDDWPDKYSQ
ncbi:MAG: RelA/SpoT domain protein [Bryobacterales bacterium]|nr:RelA/SpoT domain protein [Bryobacterales bacterium]